MDGRCAAARWIHVLSLCAAVALALSASSAFGDWTPPANPQPDKILTEAEDDACAGRYADALAKHVWFHENALKYAPAMYGVRLSFALGSWHQLAEVYPPALAELKAVRDAAATSVRAGGDPFHAFSDFAAINRELNEQGQTKDLFLWLDANNPQAAKKVFDIAQPPLIQAKEYRICGRYLDADRSFRRTVELYRVTRGEDGPDPEGDYKAEMQSFARDAFANKVANLVALLVLNDRLEDADRIAVEARKVSDDPKLQDMLARALKGELPPEWP
jgi:hypothetical protein